MQYCVWRSKRDYISRKDSAAHHNIENQSPKYRRNFNPGERQAYIHTPVLPSRCPFFHWWLPIESSEILHCIFGELKQFEGHKLVPRAGEEGVERGGKANRKPQNWGPIRTRAAHHELRKKSAVRCHWTLALGQRRRDHIGRPDRRRR